MIVQVEALLIEFLSRYIKKNIIVKHSSLCSKSKIIKLIFVLFIYLYYSKNERPNH